MTQIQGPAIFLAQFLRDSPPHDSLDNICRWAAGLGYNGVQIPAWDPRMIDLDQAASSQGYCDDYKGHLAALGLVPTELAGYLQGQVLAVHPAYDRSKDILGRVHPDLKADCVVVNPPFNDSDWRGKLTAELREQTKQSAQLDELIWANREEIGYGG